MNHHYSDLRSRIAEPPIWWDENAVPRYCLFAPSETANIYAEECVLMLVLCQSCEREFHVCMSMGLSERLRIPAERRPTAPPYFDVNSLHYGDPPNVQCCPAGPTMNSVPIRVLEYWQRHNPIKDWERVPALEVPIVCAWAEEWTKEKTT